jgi:hypothetical protein
MKISPGSDPEKDNPKEKDKNKINTKTGLKYVPFIPKIHKNHTLIKKAELMFPKIKNATNTNFFEQTQDNNMIITNFNKNNNMGFQANLNKLAQKRKNIHSKRSDKIKTLYGTYGINIKNINNNNLNTNSIPNKKSFNDKLSDIEKSNAENMNNSNNGDLFMVNLHKIKPPLCHLSSRCARIISSLTSEPSGMEIESGMLFVSVILKTISSGKSLCLIVKSSLTSATAFIFFFANAGLVIIVKIKNTAKIF